MKIKDWDQLPDSIRVPEVRKYYDFLRNKSAALTCKRAFDFVISVLMMVILLPALLIISIAIKVDSKGPVFFKQIRITQYGRRFRIIKFRSMVIDAENNGSLVTVDNDSRVTKVGKFLRMTKLDELPQLFNIIKGDMSFVGTRPEVPKYVEEYSPEMMATLLLPAGVTSLAAIYYKDESSLIKGAADVDEFYVKRILPAKMKWNLEGIITYSFWNDIKLMIMTVLTACGKEFAAKDTLISK